MGVRACGDDKLLADFKSRHTPFFLRLAALMRAYPAALRSFAAQRPGPRRGAHLRGREWQHRGDGGGGVPQTDRRVRPRHQLEHMTHFDSSWGLKLSTIRTRIFEGAPT